MSSKRQIWMAWWYFAITIAFVLLAANAYVLRDKPLNVILRLILAAGFGILSRIEFASARKR